MLTLEPMYPGTNEANPVLQPGFTRLHALNVCAGTGSLIRWIVDVPGTTPATIYQLGPPTVTRGIVYVGTTQGHLVAIADPSAWPKQGSRCSRSDVSNTDCEPNGFYLVPNPTVLLKHYVQGSTAIEAYWKSVAWPAQGLFIGEPLAAPYRKH